MSIIVALSLLTLLAAAMVAIDAGSLWSTRRALLDDTDAAALGAALHLSQASALECLQAQADATGTGTWGEAQLLLGQNGDSTLLDVDVRDCVAQSGTVRVDADIPAAVFFAPLFGFDEPDVFSSSAARYGPVIGKDGLRPLGICSEAEHYQEWQTYLSLKSSGGQAAADAYMASLAGTDPDPSDDREPHPGSYPSSMTVHRMYFEHIDGTSPCRDETAGSPGNDEGNGGDQGQSDRLAGNWGWIDFDGQSNTADCSQEDQGGQEVDRRLRDGFPCTVWSGSALTTSGDADCNDREPGNEDCREETGAKANSKAAIDAISCPASEPGYNVEGADTPCEVVWIVVYNHITESGNSQIGYHPVTFLATHIRGFDKVTGIPQADSYFDLEFLDLPATGSIGLDPADGLNRPKGVTLCDADHTPADTDHCAS